MTLAEDLVRAAAQAMSRTATARGYRLRDERQPLAAAAAVEAVLRGVVERLRADGHSGTPDWRDAYDQAANDLEMAADDLEASRG